jgi:hypothetical protein
MSADYEGISTRVHGVSAGVNGLGIPKEVLNPSLHLAKTPLRTGSMDAFKYPSLTPTGVRVPYWGSKE